MCIYHLTLHDQSTFSSTCRFVKKTITIKRYPTRSQNEPTLCQTVILREDGLANKHVKAKLEALFLRSFVTYKCVVVLGSSLAISSSLLPTDVHLTVTSKCSNRHEQFPFIEHKMGRPEPLPPPPLPGSVGPDSCVDVAESLSLSVLPGSVGPVSCVDVAESLPPALLPYSVGNACCNVAEITTLHTMISTPLNIV